LRLVAAEAVVIYAAYRCIVALRGHYAYYGVAGNIRSLQKVYRVVERYWLRMLRSRSWAAGRLTWDTFNQIKQRKPLLRPKLRLPYRELQTLAVP
jgi:RNA-directed DNA polymerase